MPTVRRHVIHDRDVHGQITWVGELIGNGYWHFGPNVTAHLLPSLKRSKLCPVMSSDVQAHAQNPWFILGLMRSRVVGKRTKYAGVSGLMRLLTGFQLPSSWLSVSSFNG